MTEIQRDILLTLNTNDCKVLNWDFAGNEVIVWCQYGNTFYRYTIDENGDATKEVFMKDTEKSCVFWSMEEHDWATINPLVKEEPGDEPFDVVVENKIKIEKEFKKMAKCDFAKIAQEVNRERFKSWVEENADDLVEYAEDCFATAYGTYMDDNADDYETMAHEAIENIVDNLWMGDYTTELEEDPEGVIEDVIM